MIGKMGCGGEIFSRIYGAGSGVGPCNVEEFLLIVSGVS